MTEKPDFKNMSAKELVAAHNALTGGSRKAPFDSKQDAIIRCEKLWVEQNPVVVEPATTIAKKFSGKKKVEGKVESKAAPKSKSAAEPNRRQVALSKVIQVSDKDPPREGTTTRKHYDEMKTGMTVGKYLDKFEDRRRASQELRNVIRNERVSLADAE